MEVVFVSGGLSGLGVHIMRLLCDRGCLPVAVGRDVFREVPAPLIGRRFGRVALGDYYETRAKLDAAIPEDCSQLTLCLNAARIDPLGLAADIDPSEFRDTVEVNFVWPVMLTHQVLNLAHDLRLPVRIILVSTGAANRAVRGWSAYSSTKAAVAQFIRSVGVDYPSVPCVIVDPGAIDTSMRRQIARWQGGETESNSASFVVRSPSEAARNLLNSTGFWPESTDWPG